MKDQNEVLGWLSTIHRGLAGTALKWNIFKFEQLNSREFKNKQEMIFTTYHMLAGGSGLQQWSPTYGPQTGTGPLVIWYRAAQRE